MSESRAYLHAPDRKMNVANANMVDLPEIFRSSLSRPCPEPSSVDILLHKKAVDLQQINCTKSNLFLILENLSLEQRTGAL